MRAGCVFVILFFTYHGCGATTYYLSANGDDRNSGTSPAAPWRTLRKLDELSRLRAGDSILLERGSNFFGTLSITGHGRIGSEIYVGAYGTGNNPVITGSTQLQNWTRYSGNIWTAKCEDCTHAPGNLFVNGQSQPLGRFPNEGYMSITRQSENPLAFQDSTLSFLDNYWNGAEVAVKSSRWTIDHLPVVSYSNKTFQFSRKPSAEFSSGYGYFIQKHLLTLDKTGEWFFDDETRSVFIYSDIKPSSGLRIEVSVSETCIKVTYSDRIKVENIAVKNCSVVGVLVFKSENVRLNNLDISDSGGNGLTVVDCINPVVENTLIQRTNNNGVEWNSNINGQFKNNRIVKTGLDPGRSQSGNGNNIALTVTSKDPKVGRNIISGNTIDSTGYNGIDFRTGHTIIENNLIQNFCMIKDDGAGIYTWNNPNGSNVIQGNIILHGKGSVDGVPDASELITSGIYIDDRSANIRVLGNTIAFCPTAGIFLHNARAIEIDSNQLYANAFHFTSREKGQLLIRRDDIVPEAKDTPFDLKVTDNLFLAPDDFSYCVFLTAHALHDITLLGSFDGNVFAAPDERQVLAQYNFANGLCNAVQTSTLQEWQRVALGVDHSSFQSFAISNLALNGENLIRNSAITTNTDGWITWPATANVIHEKANSNRDPSLKVAISPGQQALLYHSGFTLKDKQLYCLSFSAKGLSKSKLEFAPLSATSPWHALGKYACFSLDTKFQSFTYFFVAEKSSTAARVNFKGNDTFWIDNVTLRQVNKPSAHENLKIIFNMSAEQKTFQSGKNYVDLNGNPVGDQFVLKPYETKLILFTD